METTFNGSEKCPVTGEFCSFLNDEVIGKSIRIQPDMEEQLRAARNGCREGIRVAKAQQLDEISCGIEFMDKIDEGRAELEANK